MKKLLPFLFLASLIAFASCDKDDDDNSSDQILQYDGAQDNAPDFGPGNFTMAVRFPPNVTDPFTDSLLTEIRFYVQEPPSNLRAQVYGPGMNGNPGALLYESSPLTALVESDDWYTHTLTEDITITGEELWVAVSYSSDGSLRAIGCDSGPRQGNGDYVLQESLNEWETFFERTNQAESVNWNIRAKAGR